MECALWSSTDTFVEDNGVQFVEYTENLDDYELAPGVRDELAADLLAFVADPDVSADLDGMDDGQIGHDFWLTRNRHGVGFWDRGPPRSDSHQNYTTSCAGRPTTATSPSTSSWCWRCASSCLGLIPPDEFKWTTGP